jgi:predicted SAM-dependent methyltransferase
MSNAHLIQNYLENHSVRKLHLGCGPYVHHGWLNTDFSPQRPEVLFLDASQGFPFADETFDYIFSEHMIEHLTYQDGISMLRNCYRILKPNGKIRIATPDLAKILALYTKEKTEEQHFYIRALTDGFLKDVDQYHETYVINNAFRNWGHLFLYDQEILTRSLQRVGYTNIVMQPIAVSDDPHLQNIECRRDAVTIYETMVLEACKP